LADIWRRKGKAAYVYKKIRGTRLTRARLRKEEEKGKKSRRNEKDFSGDGKSSLVEQNEFRL
jgi:hypothetical protein